MKTYCDNLTLGQVSALDTFALVNGRSWKAKLRAYWERAGERCPGMRDSSRTLYALRNSHGPSWLVAFNLNRALKAHGLK